MAFVGAAICTLLIVSTAFANAPTSITEGLQGQSLNDAGNKILNVVKWVMAILTIVCAVAMAAIGAKMAALGSNPQKRADLMTGFLVAMGGTAICGGAWFLTSVGLGIFQ
ncbi:hypothetical protein F9B85_10620 [Heliorestis acidaminivorans]|uniref:Conjugal transfer protein TrbC n=2 Tax=Heliorestis TaxID=79598 RepID=A0A6I0ESW0_9FIRM|nr:MULTISPECIES: hypothetical protein [Heliorestis]KAB2952001.1 hypothetical protein F9B85_10620 [Heliorestis acidaminivorans]QGG46343.1 putative membrane protein [Heliorestis convoluta]